MSVTAFSARIRSSFSTFAIAGLMTAGVAIGSASAATTAPSATDPAASAPAKAAPTQVASTAKIEVSKTQAEAVAKELGAKPGDALVGQLTKYVTQRQAAGALTDAAAKTKAVTEAHQQLASIGGKPVTPEQAAKIDGILGIK
ncbi:hypothetical protein [Azospirillum griseum]|uniref:Uncharacterized protein n=1 Tax=Azospirillum griseum TaxID=2496639 RepID=A0A3S0K4A1_9PROT|nr:hypothetical protein [Azospirillum griseum]RTR19204.1 hypothetical protein EJ903_14380 [Azospirillum griseum]